MSKREHRRFTAEQKLEILREAEQPGVTVSAVCRCHGLAPSVFYRWRAVADNGSAVALKQDAKRMPRKDDVEARHKAEIDAYLAEEEAEVAVGVDFAHMAQKLVLRFVLGAPGAVLALVLEGDKAVPAMRKASLMALCRLGV